MQTKGASETHPALSPNDEFAGFESKFTHLLGSGGVLGLIDKSFVRNALIDGVGFQEMIGANPFKYGIVAGADSHIAASANEEFNYPGVHGNIDHSAEVRLSGAGSVAGEPAIYFGTPGATGVWAPENTREAIFDGIKRKETFGTSGPLIRVRFFGGWDFDKGLVSDKDFVKKAYEGGVPMGGDLPKKPAKAKAPTFAVWALKDPDSGNLDRVQIIKGWYDKRGYGFQKIYDVAWSDDRKPDPKTGKLPPVGNTVDVKKATYTNDIGDTQLSAGLDRSGLRSVAARRLLRARDRDPDAALVDLRCGEAGRGAAEGGRGHHPGTCLDVADLVHAGSEPGQETELLSRAAGETAAIRLPYRHPRAEELRGRILDKSLFGDSSPNSPHSDLVLDANQLRKVDYLSLTYYKWYIYFLWYVGCIRAQADMETARPAPPGCPETLREMEGHRPSVWPTGAPANQRVQ